MSDKPETVAVDPNARPVTTKQIQTEEAARAEHQFIEVMRNHTATVENKMDALLALKGAADRRPLVDDRVVFDDVDVQMARNIRELYDAHLRSELGLSLLKIADRLYMENIVENEMAARSRKPAVAMNQSRLWPLYEKFLKRADIWNTATSNEGQEWAPVGVSPTVIDIGRLQARVPAQFPQLPIRRMRSVYVPTLTGASTVRVMPQLLATTAPKFEGTPVSANSNPAIGQMQITPIKHATEPAFINMEMLEDSPAAVLSTLQMEVATALGHGWESAILNGQTTADAANLDGANGPTAAAGTYNGLRYYAVATLTGGTVDAGGGAAGYDDWVSALKLMGIFGLKNGNNVGNIGSTVAFLSPKIIFDITSDTPGGVNNLIGSYAMFGPGNPLPVGTVTMLNGIPIIPTMNWPAMLATGKVGAAANNFTCGALVDTSRWRVGVAREIEVKTAEFQLDDAVGVRGFARHGLAAAPPTTDKHTVLIRNVAA